MERPRPRGRLTRSERVASPLGPATSPLSASGSPGPFSQSSAWQLFIRDSLLHIAWPISLSSDAEVSERAVRIRMWLLFVASLSVSVSLTASQTPQPPYHYPPIPHYFDDPERKLLSPYEMNNEHDYTVPRPYQTFFAHNFAGRAQFPALVHIKYWANIADRDKAEDSTVDTVGSLVLPSFVLTTCRSVASQEGKAIHTYKPEHFIIRYCTAYEYEVNKYRDTSGNMVIETGLSKSVGFRYGKAVWCSPNSDPDELKEDWALLELNSEIEPSRTWINYMIVPYDSVGKVVHVDLTDMESQRVLCYVGSFGRTYANMRHEENGLLNRKVQFRAYHVHISDCLKFPELTCTKEFNGDCRKYDAGQLERTHIECFETRARVGTVCDHDRGAPVVCNGMTQGIVLRAARPRHCNNVYPYPFLVQRIVELLPFFTQKLAEQVIKLNPLNDPANCQTRGAKCPPKTMLYGKTVSSSLTLKGSIPTAIMHIIVVCLRLL